MLEDLANSYDLVICPYENEENRTMKDALRELRKARTDAGNSAGANAPAPRIAWGHYRAGREGNAASACGISLQLVTLGKTILRTETAGLAALAMIMYELEL